MPDKLQFVVHLGLSRRATKLKFVGQLRRISMTRLRESASRIRALFSKSRLDQDLDEELRAHLEMLVEENVRGGMSVEAARYAARRSFGGIEQTKEAYRDQRGLPIVETLTQDIRYGFRMLGKNPSFTAVAV